MTARTTLVALLFWAAALHGQAPRAFDHARHARVFVTCTVCHAGAAEAGAPLYPDSAACATCHDGTVQPRVAWQPPAAPRPTNLRFQHADHATAVARHAGGAAPACTACHQEKGAAWMTVRLAVIDNCFACHGIQTAHLAAPDTACATCHVPLPEARQLTATDVAAFPAPPSHQAADFATAHGAMARAAGANCAVCHAREFCVQCHVDAPERAAIQALASDPRSTAIHAALTAPPSHRAAGFLAAHGAMARAGAEACATCHTRESCETCHAATPRAAAKLYPAGPGRATGAVVARHLPPSHGPGWVEHHAAAANTMGSTCAACHTRADCLECHRPDAGRASGYHPAGFLSRHPAAAYARETNCADCHNTAGFCMTCHVRSGLVARGSLLRPGYHDANSAFLLGHGQAARQNLETCVTCHVEKDCIACHATGAVGGRNFNPHGPGFDANRLRQKNPEMCTACHGRSIPTE